jgi:hypothetical protein
MGTPEINNPFPRLVLRRDYRAGWLWELIADDRHVLNRSDRNFATREECEAHALENGQTLDDVVAKAPRRTALA